MREWQSCSGEATYTSLVVACISYCCAPEHDVLKLEHHSSSTDARVPCSKYVCYPHMKDGLHVRQRHMTLGLCSAARPGTFIAAKFEMAQKTMLTKGSVRPGGIFPTNGQAMAPGASK